MEHQQIVQQTDLRLQTALTMTAHQMEAIHQTEAATDLMIMTMVLPMDTMQTEHRLEQMIRTMIQIRQELSTETLTDSRW